MPQDIIIDFSKIDESEFSDLARDLLESARLMVLHDRGKLEQNDDRVVVTKYQISVSTLTTPT